MSTRHVASFTELTPEAADELGGLVRRLGTALEAVTGCVKTYLMQFSEAEGFSHLHVHLVPRLPDHPEDARGPRVIASKDDSGHIVVDLTCWTFIGRKLQQKPSISGKNRRTGAQLQIDVVAVQGACRQTVAEPGKSRSHGQGVAGSNPVSPTIVMSQDIGIPRTLIRFGVLSFLGSVRGVGRWVGSYGRGRGSGRGGVRRWRR